MFYKRIVPVLIFILGSFMFPKTGYAQLKTYQFKEVQQLQKEDPRDLVVFIHADWCTYCHTMVNTTFKDKTVIRLLNNNFYFIPLDAEDKDNITFGGQTFRYKATGAHTGINELAEALGQNEQGELSYPSLVLLNQKNEMIYQYGGFLNREALGTLLKKVKNRK